MQDTNNSTLSFEDFKNENGLTYWWASDLLIMLGYKDMKSFQNVLDKATKAFVSLNIPHYENIIAEMREKSGRNMQDFKLTRFACYIAVMNASPTKVEVATAQAYFAHQTRKFELFIQDNDEFERLHIREELIEGNKSLASVAFKAKVEDFAKFQNAGYVGMYNMPSWKLENKRKVKIGTLMDYMGRTELAANLFRITQTEERIKNKKIIGQANLEQTHFQVGQEVRDIVKKNTGKNPESLPKEKQLSEVKKELKVGHKKMIQEDEKPKK